MGKPKKGKAKGKGKGKGGKGKGGGSNAGGWKGSGGGAAQVWRAGLDPIEDGEELDYDRTAYLCLQSFRLSWPCLSFDVVRDGLGDARDGFPVECYMAAGTQANDPNNNGVTLARLANVGQGRHGPKPGGGASAMDEDGDESSSSDDDSDSEDEGSRPSFSSVEIHHRGAINRVRALNAAEGDGTLVATWGETGHVQVWDMTAHVRALPTQRSKMKQVHQSPVHIVQHSMEGYALDWSRDPSGGARLLTGDCKGQLLLSTSPDGAAWTTEREAFIGHEGSVEDLQWSPSEATVFASSSVDQHVKIWDTRQRAKPGLSYKAHDCDVNVISWNRLTSCMVASGGDDGTMRIWDMRYIANGQYVANFDYCKGAVTSIEWSPWEASVLATSSADDQICFWDLSVERDAAEEMALAGEGPGEGEGEGEVGEFGSAGVAIPKDIPPQLLFVHQGQHTIKEVHWHPQIKSMVLSTAYDGFNLFRPTNI